MSNGDGAVYNTARDINNLVQAGTIYGGIHFHRHSMPSAAWHSLLVEADPQDDPAGADDLAAARVALDAAACREAVALADLRAAGIQARLAMDEMGYTLSDIARMNRLSPSTFSKLRPRSSDGAWEPLRFDSYRTIDEITGGQYRLAEHRRALDHAKLQVRRAQDAMSLAEARTEMHTARTPPGPTNRAARW